MLLLTKFVLCNLELLVGKDYQQLKSLNALNPPAITFTEAEKILSKILQAWSDISEITPLGDKWKGGMLILKPGEVGLKEKGD